MISSLRETARHLVLNGFATLDSIRNSEKQISTSQIVQVVNFHHLYPYEMDSFRKFLKWFGEYYNVISYSDAVERVRHGNIGKPYGAITFDDGLKSVMNAGEILDEFGFSATFFVCSGIIGETRPGVLRSFCVDAKMVYESDEFVSWEDLESLKSRGHEIGNHTVTHPWLGDLTADQIQEELTVAQEVLASKLGDIEHFAWPFGSFESLGRRAAEQLIKCGYTSVGSGVRGSHAPHTTELDQLPLVCLRRDNLEARWPLGHIKHFLIRNSVRPIGCQQWWPNEWNISV